MTLGTNAHVRLGEDVLIQQVGEESVLLNLNTEFYFALDEPGTRMIMLLQEGASVAEAIGKLKETYGVEEARLLADLSNLVEECQEHGLVQVTEA